MRLRLSSCLILSLCATSYAAAEPPGKVVQETWDAVYLENAKAGFVRTTVHEVESDGQKLLRTTLELNLSIQRFGNVAQMRQISGTEETKDGKVTGVFMTQELGKQQQLVLSGTVEGDQLHYKVDGKMELDKKVPWNDKVIGLYREMNLFKDRAAKPGDEFSYLHYEPSIGYVVTIRVQVKDYEELKTTKGKKKFLRIDAKPDKIQNVQLPPTSFWVNQDLQVVRSEVEMPGLGKLLAVRTKKEDALAKGSARIGPPPSLNTLIHLNQPIVNPHEVSSVVYRITLPKDDDPATAFVQDNRQTVRNVKDHSFELVVRAVRKPEPMANPPKIGDEFLKSNYFLNCDDERVKEHAKKAVGREKDPWRKAQLIERWVRDNMKILNFTEAMATADHVARTLEGDCSEFSMLAAAMCRAVGVPSRIAMGFVYVDHRQQGPMLGYHMWTEVSINGQWLAIDATLGQGSVGAAHLKITDHSWHDVQSLTPLLPVMRVMSGKISVEVLSVNEGE